MTATTARPAYTLPGLDPMFHEARKYLSPMRVKGELILASFGSCKETGCNYSAAWATNAGRDLGMWKHRSDAVRDARLDFFMRKMRMGPDKATEMLGEFADKHSHTFENWMELVEAYFRNLAGVGIDDDSVPTINWAVKYQLGKGAKAVVTEILDVAYNTP